MKKDKIIYELWNLLGHIAQATYDYKGNELAIQVFGLHAKKHNIVSWDYIEKLERKYEKGRRYENI